MALCFVLNGAPFEARDVDPNTTLLSLLRAHGFTGTKEGCGEGECGACAVVLTRKTSSGARYEAVHACLTLAHAVADQEVRTVEGVANGGSLHPVQVALCARGASQCGYCTPGFVMSLWAEFYRQGRRETDLESIAGNLCRCTGYRPIRDAARALPQVDAGDPHLLRLFQPAPALGTTAARLGTSGFLRPTTLAELWSALRAHPKAKLIAGGTDVVTAINQVHERSDVFITLEHVAELRGYQEDADAFSVGAALTLNEVDDALRGRIQALDMLWPLFGSRLVRARATLGGNLNTASPIGDSSPVLLALDATLVLVSESGSRSLPLKDFFIGYRKTALRPLEILQAVRIAKPTASATRFYKVSKRVSDDISSVSAAFALSFDGATVTGARVAYGGVADRPLRLFAVEDALRGRSLDRATLEAASKVLVQTITPLDDARASAAYRLHVACALLRRLFRELSNVSESTEACP